MKWLRDALFSNWRNKGVALFFAVTIWYAAYQSEKKEFMPSLKVLLAPKDTENYVFTRVTVDSEVSGLEGQEFDGTVTVTFSGPRKEIESLKEAQLHPVDILVPPDRTAYTFRQEDFGYPQEGVDITNFEPPAVIIVQEERARVQVKDVAEKISVTGYPEGYEVALKEVVPSSQEVTVTGPKSLVGRTGISVNVALPFVRDRYEGKVDVTLNPPEDISSEMVRRTLTVQPPQVFVRVAVRATMDALPADAVRVSFRIPPVKIPVKITMDDIDGDTIPVEFYGRKDEIARLRERLRDQHGFSLGVRVPPFDRELGGQFTFTEDSLELHGFPGIQIRQHESRRRDKKTAWSYTVLPVKESEK